MKDIKTEIEQLDKKKILIAAAAIALGAKALRSYKLEGEHLTFDVSVWGESAKTVISDVIDDTKNAAGRLAGKLILGPNNEIHDVIPLEEAPASIESIEAMARALSDRKGWSGQTRENTLQES